MMSDDQFNKLKLEQRLRTEIDELREEMRNGFAEMRNGFIEMRNGFAEMHDGFAAIAEAISAIHDDNEVASVRITSLDKRLTKLERKAA